MVDSPPDPIPARLVLMRALLAGAALGAVCIASAGLVLFDAEGLLTGATGLTATILAALLTGIWAGAPRSDLPLPIAERWAAAGVATAVAGGFATFLTLYGAVGPGALTRVVSLLALVAVPVYLIGMLLPVLLEWGEQQLEELGEEDGGGGDVLGPLVVGVLGGAVIGVVVAGVALVTWIGAGPLLLGVAVMLFAPVVLPEPVIVGTNERLLAEVQTPFSHLRVTEVVFPAERQPERRLYIGDEQESGELVRSGVPTLAYIVAAEAWLTSSTPAGASYLFLGGGAYTLPRRIAERDASARVTVVELDPEITRIAARFFGLRRDHAIRSVHGDARAFLAGDDGVYDRIYLDVYAGSEALPYPLITREAFEAARDRLAPGGTLGVNAIGVAGGGEGTRVWSVVRTVADVFPAVAVYSHFGPDYPDRQNLLLVAAAEEQAEFPPRAGMFERWPAAEWPPAGTTVYRDLFPPASRDPAGAPQQAT